MSRHRENLQLDNLSHTISQTNDTTTRGLRSSGDSFHNNRGDVEPGDLDTRVLRKLDYVLLPFLALLFLFNSLDRSNVSAAHDASLTYPLIVCIRLAMQR